MKNKKLSKCVIFIGSAVLFFAVTVPLRKLLPVFVVSEVRPAAALNPVLSILLGPAAAFGCAVGNFAADIISGYELSLCLIGFPVQLLFGLLPMWLFHLLNRTEENPYALDSLRKLLRFLAVIVVSALVISVLLGILAQAFGYTRLFSMSTVFMFLNDLDFGIVLGCPILIFTDRLRKHMRHLGNNISLNELLILWSVLSGVMLSVVIGVLAYRWVRGTKPDVFSLWSEIFITVSVVLNLYFLMMILVLQSTEQWKKKNYTSSGISASMENSVLRIILSGKLFDESAANLRTTILLYLPRAKTVLLDLSGLEYISSGCAKVLRYFKEHTPQGCMFQIENANPMLTMVLRMSGLVQEEEE